MDTISKIIPSPVLDAYGLVAESVERVESGLINETWFVTTRENQRYVIQRLHSAIPRDVNSKIEFVTQRLVSQNVTTPSLLPTSSGEIFFETAGSQFRVLTFIAGTSFHVISDPNQAFEAGTLLAKFHGALKGVDHSGVLSNATVHNLQHHLTRLRLALEEHNGHQKILEISEIAEDIFANAEELPNVEIGDPQAVHGDPKISNFLFDDAGRGVCMVDLDTVSLMPIAWELGDAFRSWCNPSGEDTDDTRFSLEIFEAGLQGYASKIGIPFSARDVENIVPAIQSIYIELAARFCADALYESYFAWDPKKFSTHADHNIVRARGQLGAARDLVIQRSKACGLARAVFASNAGR
jgi:Ser/Thr protein kinase RdoA (MazF antagonist)